MGPFLNTSRRGRGAGPASGVGRAPPPPPPPLLHHHQNSSSSSSSSSIRGKSATAASGTPSSSPHLPSSVRPHPTSSPSSTPNPTRPVHAKPSPAAPAVVSEYKLLSSGNVGLNHIMRIQNQNHDLTEMKHPIIMSRLFPEADLGLLAEPDAPGAADGPVAEKMDPSKVAPFGSKQSRSQPFKKKSRQLFMGITPEGGDPLKRGRIKDPDRFPWAMTSANNLELIGNAENQSAQYMLFIVPNNEPGRPPVDGLLVQPAAKWYRFAAKPKYQIMSTEEAEASLKKLERGGRMPIKKEESLVETAEKIDGIKLKKEDLELMNRQLKKTQIRATSEFIKNEAKARRVNENKDLEEELDFDEAVSDDEDIDFGIEDEQEAKQAKQREFGTKINRANFDDDDEEDVKKKPAAGKAIKKVLRKFEGSTYVSDDEENPYGEEEESEDEEEEDIFEAIQKDKAGDSTASPSLETAKASKGKKKDTDGFPSSRVKKEAMDSPALSKSKPGSPAVQALKSGTPTLGTTNSKPGTPSSGRVKIKVGGGGVSPSLDGDRKRKADGEIGSDPKKAKASSSGTISPDLPPPPPSAAEILARQKEEERNRKLAKRNASTASSSSSSRSPAPSSSSGPSPRVGSPNVRVGGGTSPQPAPPRAASPRLHSSSPAVSSPLATPALESGRSSPMTGIQSDGDLLTDDDVRALFFTSKPPTTVKEIIAALRDKITKDERNKDRIRVILRQLCNLKDGIVTLK